jgi:hypothetical protein
MNTAPEAIINSRNHELPPARSWWWATDETVLNRAPIESLKKLTVLNYLVSQIG